MNLAVDNLYVVRNANGTLDTVQSSDPRMAGWILSGCGYEDRPRGGMEELTQVTILAKLQLDSTALKFNYSTSQN